MKNQHTSRWWLVVAAVAATASLTACFGGRDDDVPSVTSEVPPSASQSSAGFIAYLQALVVADADTLEPVDTASVTAPTDETLEPVAIN